MFIVQCSGLWLSLALFEGKVIALEDQHFGHLGARNVEGVILENVFMNCAGQLTKHATFSLMSVNRTGY